MISSNEWPQPKENLHVSVLAHLEADIYSLDYRKDRLLHIEINPEIPEEELPELVKMFAQSEMLLNPAVRPALRRMLDMADEADLHLQAS